MRPCAPPARTHCSVDARGLRIAGACRSFDGFGARGIGRRDERARLDPQRVRVPTFDDGIVVPPRRIRSRSAAEASSAAAASSRRIALSCSPSVRSVAPSAAVRSAPASPRARNGASTISTAASSASSARSSRPAASEERLQRADVGTADPQARRRLGRTPLPSRPPLPRDRCGAFRHLRLVSEQLRLLGERAPARIELE